MCLFSCFRPSLLVYNLDLHEFLRYKNNIIQNIKVEDDELKREAHTLFVDLLVYSPHPPHLRLASDRSLFQHLFFHRGVLDEVWDEKVCLFV